MSLIALVNSNDLRGVGALLKSNPGLINEKDSYADTALMFAVRNKKQGIVQLLVEQEGINLNLQDNNGYTALILAVYLEYQGIVQLLVKQEGIDLNVQDNYGTTALMLAVDRGYQGMVQLLVEQEGIDLNLQDDDNKTALDIAVETGYTECVNILRNGTPAAKAKRKAEEELEATEAKRKAEEEEEDEKAEAEASAPLKEWLSCVLDEIDTDVGKVFHCFSKNGLKTLKAVRGQAKLLVKHEIPLKWTDQLGDIVPLVIIEALEQLVPSTTPLPPSPPPTPLQPQVIVQPLSAPPSLAAGTASSFTCGGIPIITDKAAAAAAMSSYENDANM